MRLVRFSVEKLFGLFDHTVSLSSEDHVSIVHAPNGYGKTIILKMISGMFGGSLNIFRSVEFKTASFDFNNGHKLVVRQGPTQPDLMPLRVQSDSRTYTIYYRPNGDELSWSPDESAPGKGAISPSMFERYIPHLRRIGPREWRDLMHGDIIHYDLLVERYWSTLPASVRRQGPHPEWLRSLRDAIHCRFVETNRLLATMTRPGTRSTDESVPAVTAYSVRLAEEIEKVLAGSATIAQSLDKSFPNRILHRLRDEQATSETDLRETLSNLEKKRRRLSAAGLLDTGEEDAISPNVRLDLNERKILTEYVQDAAEKLSAYSPMLEKLELFADILNSRYVFKKVKTSREKGVSVFDYRGEPLLPEALSSGEQHEFILIFDLLFNTQKDTLILIDEPEISLHVAWQKRFIPDLETIIKLTGAYAVIATHSAQIIGSYLNLTTQLQRPDNVFDHQ